jgi:hypothetical protein
MKEDPALCEQLENQLKESGHFEECVRTFKK